MNHSTPSPLNLPGFVTCRESTSTNPCTERARMRCRTGSCWGEDSYQTSEGEWLCSRALEDALVECGFTTNPDGTPVRLHPDQMVELPGNIWCQAGYYAENCQACSTPLYDTRSRSCTNIVDRTNPSTFFHYQVEDPARHLPIDEYFCTECYEFQFVTCVTTGQVVHYIDSVIHEGAHYSAEGYRRILTRQEEALSQQVAEEHARNPDEFSSLIPDTMMLDYMQLSMEDVTRRGQDSTVPDAYHDSAYLGRGVDGCGRQLIHQYHHRPDLYFYGGSRSITGAPSGDEPFLGWELETCTASNDCADPWYDNYNCDRGAYEVYNSSEFGERLLHCEHDGSVSGFEIVSHPGTFKFWKENPDIIDNICQLRHHGYTSHNGAKAGHHVHISSNAIEEEQFFKMQLMVYNPCWKDFWYGISQRTESHANGYARMDMSIEEIKARTKAARGLCSNSDKEYLLSNTNRNNETASVRASSGGYRNFARMMALIGAGRSIEFRLFRGTLLPSRFFKNLEVVQSIWKFTKEHTFGKCMDLRWWLDYISRNSGEYENLDTYIREQPYRQFSLTPSGDAENIRKFHNWLYPEATTRRIHFPMLHVPYLDPEFMRDLELAA